jgi:hypothetical protein
MVKNVSSVCGEDVTVTNEGDLGSPNIEESEGVVDGDTHLGGVFRFSDGDGPPTRVRVLEVLSTDDVTTTYMVTDDEGNKFEARTAMLIPEDVVDLSSIPQTSDEYYKEAASLSPDDLDHIVNPQTLSPDQQEFLRLHHKMGRLPFPRLIRFAETKGSNVPKRLAYLKHNPPVCASCIFVRSKRRP